MSFKKSDMVNSPPHYKGKEIEVIDVIEAFELNFNKGTILAYLLRAGKKVGCPELEDLKKAKWYLEREINALEID